jgi:hypothetical protein
LSRVLWRTSPYAPRLIDLPSPCGFVTHTHTHAPRTHHAHTPHHTQDFEKCKARLIERGESFREKALLSRGKISSCADPFIRDGLVRSLSHPPQPSRVSRFVVDRVVSFVCSSTTGGDR